MGRLRLRESGVPQGRMIAGRRHVDVDVRHASPGPVAAKVDKAHAAHFGPGRDPTLQFLHRERVRAAGRRPDCDGTAAARPAPSAHEPIGSGDAELMRRLLLVGAVVFDRCHGSSFSLFVAPEAAGAR